MAIDSRARNLVRRLLDPVGAVLARSGVTANWMTAAGIFLTGVAAALLAREHFTAAGLVLIAGSLADALDGPVARARGITSLAGSFYDSVADRVADGLILSAVAWAVRDDPVLFAAGAIALVAAQVTSYVRAKAESLGVMCAIGLLERAERAIALIIGLLFHRWLLAPVLWLLAIGGSVTVVQRIVHVVRKFHRLPLGGEGA
ncbi:MAG: CDP-alcohol phosphatidyltransferase family protein [Nitriliruptorales bacterium]